MKYLLFSGSHYYPEGGWNDFIGAYPTIELANEKIKITSNDWFHVVDIETMQIVVYINH